MTGCACENKSCSDFSPGLVENDEIIVRQIYSPIHLDPDNGDILPTAFSDVKTIGLSVNRLKHISPASIESLANQKCANDAINGKERNFIGIIKARTAHIRALIHEDKRVFCVKDTAKREDISHADVVQENCFSKSESKKQRSKLLEIFSNRVLSCKELE